MNHPSPSKFGFMYGRSTMEAIYLLRLVMERYQTDKKDIPLVRIVYIKAIKNMYEGASTSVRTRDGTTKDIPITIGLHQGSTLGELASRCILFADDVVLLGESREEVNGRLETWRQA